jgi:hypothetical protein
MAKFIVNLKLPGNSEEYVQQVITVGLLLIWSEISNARRQEKEIRKVCSRPFSGGYSPEVLQIYFLLTYETCVQEGKQQQEFQNKNPVFT